MLNFCSWVTRKSYSLYVNHNCTLDTLDFTSSKQLASPQCFLEHIFEVFFPSVDEGYKRILIDTVSYSCRFIYSISVRHDRGGKKQKHFNSHLFYKQTKQQGISTFLMWSMYCFSMVAGNLSESCSQVVSSNQ